MDNFNKRENEGRLKWLNLNINDILNGKKVIAFTEDKYCPYDMAMTSTTLSYGEIKDVHRAYSKYPDFMIDAAKIKKLEEACMEEDRTPLLIAFFDDCTIVWDTSKVDWTTRVKPVECTCTTASNYTHGQKTKLETRFTINEAIYVKRYQLDN